MHIKNEIYQNQTFSTDVEDYHRDPGEVNIHQFYPVLEHTFNKNNTGIKSQTEALIAIAEEDSHSEQTVDDSLGSRAEVGQYQKKKSCFYFI